MTGAAVGRTDGHPAEDLPAQVRELAPAAINVFRAGLASSEWALSVRFLAAALAIAPEACEPLTDAERSAVRACGAR